MKKKVFVLIHDGNTHISGKNYNFNSQARIDNYSDFDEMTQKVLC